MALYYFAYGSNMNPERVRKRNMGFEAAEAGKLYDYELAFNKRSVKYPGAASANVIEQPGSHTEGVIYKLSDPAQIQEMDPYEGYPVRYNRLALPIEVSGGTVDAWVYIANEEYIMHGLRPARWYLEHLLAGRSYLSERYYLALSEVDCLPDSTVEPA